MRTGTDEQVVIIGHGSRLVRQLEWKVALSCLGEIGVVLLLLRPRTIMGGFSSPGGGSPPLEGNLDTHH